MGGLSWFEGIINGSKLEIRPCLECWSTGVLEQWSIGVLEYWIVRISKTLVTSGLKAISFAILVKNNFSVFLKRQ
jgi:hypothetical protein